MSNTKFSILIPCYGKAKYLDGTIKSILSQPYSNFEIIICRQGNTLINGNIINDGRIKIIHMEKPSSYLSRIELFRNASGDYVWFVDDDDEIVYGSLNILNSIIQKTSPDCIAFDKIDVLGSTQNEYSHESDFDDNMVAQYPKENALNDLLTTNNFNNIWGKVFRRNLNPNWIPTDLFQSEDKLLNYALYKVSQTFLRVKYPLYKYHLYHGMWSRPLSIERLNDSILSRQTLIGLEPRFTDSLLEDILDRIVIFLSNSHSKGLEDKIDFNFGEYDFSSVLKKATQKKRFLYKLVIKKKYGLLRALGKINSLKKINKKTLKTKCAITINELKHVRLLIIPLVCFSILSPISLLSSSSKIQDVAKLVTQDTKQNGYGIITFAPIDSSSGNRPSFSNEYYTLHDQFNSYSRAMETYDSQKKLGLRIVSFCDEYDGEYKEIETTESSAISFLCSPGIQVETSKEVSAGVEQTIYRNFIYKFQFKYLGLEKGNIASTHYPIYCALRQGQADELIDLINETNGTEITEEELIGHYIGVQSSYSDEKYTFRIFNIIKDKSDYLDDYISSLGNFIFVNDYMLNNIELCNSYMMTKTEYENYYNLKTCTELYKKIGFKALYGNSTNYSSKASIIQSKLDATMKYEPENIIMFGVFLALDFIVMCAFIILLLSNKIIKTYPLIIVGMTLPIFPYLIFKIIVLCSKSSLAFSYLTGNIYFILALLYEVFMLYQMLRLIYANK